MTLVAWG